MRYLRMNKYIFMSCMLICISIAYAVLLSGCSRDKASGGTAPAPSFEFEALSEIKEGRPDIYLILKLIDSSYWQVIIDGAYDAASELDCNLYMSGTANETDWEGQLSILDSCIERGADAIILAPDDSVKLSPKIDEIYDQGIPVVLIDTAANTDSFDVCYMTDNLLAGQIAAQEMLDELKLMGVSENENACIGIVVGTAASLTINERLAGFYQYWTNNAPDKWFIVSDIMNCNGDISRAEGMIKDTISANPSLRGLYGTNNGPSKAIAGFVSASGRSDIAVVGFDYSDEIKSIINSDDHYASTVLQRQYDMSFMGTRTALELLNGGKPASKFVDTGVVTVNRRTLKDPDVISVIEHN
ncbi:MAG: ABC transporter substrate-binding protein [Lachnospiraceae bacterium]|nr:ABC transporter substrate-binding protein [Lachnospiraceae bacterium]